MTLDCGPIKATMGILAMAAAGAAGLGAPMTAPLFGALIGIALSAGAAWAALLEVMDSDAPHWGWRLAAWGVLVAGWGVFAATLLNAPLGPLDRFGFLVLLIASGAALRAWRWQVRLHQSSLSVVCNLVFALLTLAAVWSGVRLHVGYMLATTIGCALELFATGASWLAEALITRSNRPTTGSQRAALRASTVLQPV